MLKIGNYNTLKVVKEVDFGIYLDGGEEGEILMPLKYVPKGVEPEDEIEVFIYSDTEDRLIATTETPLAKVNEFAHLKVNAVNKYGAFLEWGIIKELLVPFREQKVDMEKDFSYIVYIYLDQETNRLVASAKVNKFLSKETPPYEVNDEVNILIQRKTFVKKVRTDGKIDLALQKSGYAEIDSVSQKILKIIEDNDGFIGATDKSSPDLIKAIFNVSKKSFKKAVGSLYKQRLITIDKDGISIIKK